MTEFPAQAAAPLTHKRILSIAVPIVLANATVPILGAVDTGVVGQMGQAAPIGAVGIGTVILASVYWLFGFLRMGTTGLVAQARGANEHGEVSALLMRAILIGFMAGIALIVLQVPILWGAFRLAPASEEVETLARSYIQIRIFSAPFAISIFGLTGWLIASERTKAVLILQLWMNGLNIILDIWFVLGLGWGVEGVALATVISEVTGAAFGLFLARSAMKHPDWKSWAKVFDPKRLVNMARVNTDIMIRSILLLSIMVSFAFFGAGFGDVTLAANHILMQFIEITAYALDGFAFTAEVIVGQALGAKSRQVLRRGAIMASLWGGGAALILAASFALFGAGIIDTMTTAEAVQAEARRYLPWMVSVPILGLAAWMLDGVFIGATRTRDMRNMSFVSLAVYIACVYSLIPIFGNHGLWASLVISYVVRAVALGWKYPALEQQAATYPVPSRFD
ncbi:MATE family multidrug resistance protein [Pacificibacter maritimus]|uniref:MATE family multidrug resistance protein n=1 Tax=Pacificibacter maritimus TaxID=762213 RepID=A0A3N4UGF5_9RHOB|nr:MATE family efflux transporter [Pacificibacter maritimus]RPE66321.1 MATE family multidrug resistance protein [Pacificibacter maritimus]